MLVGERFPAVKLKCHDQDVVTQDVRVREYPLLKVASFRESGFGKGDLVGRFGNRAFDREDKFITHAANPCLETFAESHLALIEVYR